VRERAAPPPRGMLGKGMQVLVALGRHPEGVSLSRLAEELGFPVSTTHRLLQAMLAAGFVGVDDERRTYELGLTVFQLSHQVARVRTLSELALPVLRRVTEVSGEQTLLAVRQGGDLIYLEKVEGGHQIRNHAEVGQRGDLHSSSMGKSLLAWLPEEERDQVVAGLRLVRHARNTITDRRRLIAELDLTRRRGWAVNEEENEEGIRSRGLPIIGPRGRPVCAICVTAPVFRCSREQIDSYVPLMQQLVREIEARLPRGGAPAIAGRPDGARAAGRR
jgi:IclR family acetate operon transcriptional repressor